MTSACLKSQHMISSALPYEPTHEKCFPYNPKFVCRNLLASGCSSVLHGEQQTTPRSNTPRQQISSFWGIGDKRQGGIRQEKKLPRRMCVCSVLLLALGGLLRSVEQGAVRLKWQHEVTLKVININACRLWNTM
ncbi:hypothetical protein GQ457_14G018500 [Hibiscus cannabinus]